MSYQNGHANGFATPTPAPTPSGPAANGHASPAPNVLPSRPANAVWVLVDEPRAWTDGLPAAVTLITKPDETHPHVAIAVSAAEAERAIATRKLTHSRPLPLSLDVFCGVLADLIHQPAFHRLRVVWFRPEGESIIAATNLLTHLAESASKA